MRRDRADRPRLPWGTVTVTGAAAAGAWAGDDWWTGLPVPRTAPASARPHPGAVPVGGPAARDADRDGTPETLVVEGPAGLSLWSDTDGDGFADRVVTVGGATAGGAETDRAAVDGAVVDGAPVDRVAVDGAPVDGAPVDGAAVGTVAVGAVMDGTAVGGPGPGGGAAAIAALLVRLAGE